MGTAYQVEKYDDAGPLFASQLENLSVTLVSQYSSLILATTSRHMIAAEQTLVIYTEGLNVDALSSAPRTKIDRGQNLFNAAIGRLEHDINPAMPAIPHRLLNPPTTTTTTTPPVSTP
jgi:hypothetical protein